VLCGIFRIRMGSLGGNTAMGFTVQGVRAKVFEEMAFRISEEKFKE